MWETSAQFWAERGRFVAGIKARQQGKAKTVVTPSGRFTVPSIQQQERKWTLNATKYLALRPSALKYAMAEKVDGVAPLVRRLLTALEPALAKSFDVYVGAAALNALEQWPVSSGYSKGSMTLGYTQGTEFELIGAVGNSAPYAIYIKGGPFPKLIRTPMREAARSIAATLRIGA